MKTAVGYKAQALAIVMIVLVISIVMGMAMLSRVLRDNFRVVNEKSSAEALETADSIIDSVKGTSVSALKASCAKPEFGTGIDQADGCKIQGVENVVSFLSDVGVGADSSTSLSNCQDETSTLELTTKLASEQDDLEIRPDSVRSFVLRGQTPNPGSCSLLLTVEPRGTAVGGLMISRVYGRNYTGGIAGEYKPYAYGDILPYCIFAGGSDCSGNPSLSDSWTPVAAGSQITVPLGASGGYSLDEVRVRSVNSIISLRASLSNANCITDWEMVKMTVGANCTGSYRAKEVQVPQQEWALPIFDYVLYNGTGTLQPQ
ncbi:hypothetical protein IT417_02310 [bacterium]|nr:hypothetical protein [bacterium]